MAEGEISGVSLRSTEPALTSLDPNLILYAEQVVI